MNDFDAYCIQHVAYGNFGGGAARGYAYLGVIERLAQFAPQWFTRHVQGAAGTSIGTLPALLMCCGVASPAFLNALLHEWRLHEPHVFVPNMSTLFHELGLDCTTHLGASLTRVIHQLLSERRRLYGSEINVPHSATPITLMQLHALTQRHFMVWATCVPDNSEHSLMPMRFDHVHTPDVYVHDAMRASMCIPGAYTPVRLLWQHCRRAPVCTCQLCPTCPTGNFDVRTVSMISPHGVCTSCGKDWPMIRALTAHDGTEQQHVCLVDGAVVNNFPCTSFSFACGGGDKTWQFHLTTRPRQAHTKQAARTSPMGRPPPPVVSHRQNTMQRLAFYWRIAMAPLEVIEDFQKSRIHAHNPRALFPVYIPHDLNTVRIFLTDDEMHALRQSGADSVDAYVRDLFSGVSPGVVLVSLMAIVLSLLLLRARAHT